jgi:hypothetical protein
MNNGSTAGMLMGAYHYATPEPDDAVEEAEYFLQVAGDYITQGYLRPVLDLEQGSEMGITPLSNWVHDWMDTIERETGVQPLLYVNSDYANNYLDYTISQYDLWIAHWTYNPYVAPDIGMWDTWIFWQYSNQGIVPGVTGNVDIDFFKGTLSELNDFVITTQNFSYPLYAGWNLITIPLTNTWTAETLGQNITNCTTVTGFNGSTQYFTSHVVGTPHDNFPIQGGRGYFIYVTNESTLTLTGLAHKSVSVPIFPSWNLIGWYHGQFATAESVGQNISGCNVVIMFEAETESFLSHVVGVPHDNFNIERGMGLFIYTDEASYWHGEG